MLVEGKLIATGLEIVAKKLVDIFGDHALTLLKGTTTRAAAYEAYRALRKIEETFKDIENLLNDSIWSQFSNEEWISEPLTGFMPLSGDPRTEILYQLQSHLDTLSRELTALKTAFSKFKLNMEIYDSIEKAAEIKIFLATDADVLEALFNYRLEKAIFDMPSLIVHMRAASSLARQTLSEFISRNFKIEQQKEAK